MGLKYTSYVVAGGCGSFGFVMAGSYLQLATTLNGK
jgi:hypothetical protein